jgi:hypothetical protein
MTGGSSARIAIRTAQKIIFLEINQPPRAGNSPAGRIASTTAMIR